MELRNLKNRTKPSIKDESFNKINQPVLIILRKYFNTTQSLNRVENNVHSVLRCSKYR